MPRNVRNFWIELDVDGRKSTVETGPRSRDGGFELTIYQRHKGEVRRALEVRGYGDFSGDGALRIVVQPAGDLASNGHATQKPGRVVHIDTER